MCCAAQRNGPLARAARRVRIDVRAFRCRGPTARNSAARRTAGRSHSPAAGVLRQLELLLGRRPSTCRPAPSFFISAEASCISVSTSLASSLVPSRPPAGPGWPGIMPLPVHRDHLLDEVLGLQRIEVDHAAARERADRDGVDDEDDLLLRQPHHQRGVGVVEAEIVQLERGAAELDDLLVADRLVGQRRVRILERLEPLRGVLVRDDRGAGVLERLAAGDVVEVVVAVDQVLDRLVGDLLDLVDILLPAGRPAVGDRIGGDHAVLGDDEHRLMVAVAEDVDVVGAVDLLGLDLRPWLAAPAPAPDCRARAASSTAPSDVTEYT